MIGGTPDGPYKETLPYGARAAAGKTAVHRNAATQVFHDVSVADLPNLRQRYRQLGLAAVNASAENALGGLVTGKRASGEIVGPGITDILGDTGINVSQKDEP